MKSQTRQQITSPHSLTTSHRPATGPGPPPALPTRWQRNEPKTEELLAQGRRVCPCRGAKPGRAERWPHHRAGKQNSAGRRHGCTCPPSLPRSRAAPVPARLPRCLAPLRLPGDSCVRGDGLGSSIASIHVCPSERRPESLPLLSSSAELPLLLPSVCPSQGCESSGRSPPPTPFSLPTMPWEPEKCSRASSSFCMWFCFVWFF